MMKLTRCLPVLRNEMTLLGYSLRLLIGRNVLAVGLISTVLLVAVFSYTLPMSVTKVAVLLRQLELFAPLLGIVIFSDLMAGDVASKRATLLRSSRSGMVPVVLRKLVHGLLIISVVHFFNLFILRGFYTSFNVFSAFLIVIPGALYFGMIGLLAATFTARALAGYAAGTSALVLSMVVKQVMPLTPVSFGIQRDLANINLFGDANWVFAKVAFVVLSAGLACFVILLANKRKLRTPLISMACLLLASCYAVTHNIWSQPPSLSVHYSSPSKQLDVFQSNDTLVIRSAATQVWRKGRNKGYEETHVTDTLYTRDHDRWNREKEIEYDPLLDADIQHVDLKVNVAPNTAHIHAQAEARIKVNADRLHKLYMRLGWELQVSQVVVNGQRVRFEKTGNLVEISLNGPVIRDERLSVRLEYEGDLQLPSSHHPSERVNKTTLFVTSRWFPSLKSWFHTGSIDTFTFDVHATVPRGWYIASGLLVNQQDTTVTYRFRTTCPSDRIAMVATKTPPVQIQVGDIPVTLTTTSIGNRAIEKLRQRVITSLALLQDSFGPYPHESLAIVESDFISRGGGAFPGIVLINGDRCRKEHLSKMLDYYIPHEIAHQWFSMNLPPWIAESGAVFSNYLVLTQLDDQGQALARFTELLDTMFQSSKNNSTPLRNGSDGLKGAYLPVMLMSANKEKTIQSIRTFIQGRMGLTQIESETVEALYMAALKDANASEFDMLVSDWVNTLKTFDPAVTSLTQVKTVNGFQVWASLEHQGDIRFSVPVRLCFDDGTSTDKVWTTTADSQDITWTLDKSVQSITLDPNKATLDWNRFNNRRMAKTVSASAAETQPESPVTSAQTAQTGLTGWTTFSTADGLMDNHARCLTRGPRGQVLAGFHDYGQPGTAIQHMDSTWTRPDTTSTSSGPIMAMAVHPDGTLWAASLGKLHHITEKNTSVFVLSQFRHRNSIAIGQGNLEPNPLANSNIAGFIIYEMAIDTKGQLWLATDNGISVLDAEGQVLRHMTTEDGLPSNEVLCLTWEENNTLWIGTDKGCAAFSKNTWSIPDLCPKGLILSIATDSKGRVYLGTRRSGVFVYDGMSIRGYSSFNSDLPHDMVTALVCDAQDRLWAGTTQGLWCLEDQEEQVITQQNSELRSNNITELMISNQILWIATHTGITTCDLSVEFATSLDHK